MQVLTVALFQRPGAIGNSLLIKEIPQERKLFGGKIPGFLAIHRCRFFMLFTVMHYRFIKKSILLQLV